MEYFINLRKKIAIIGAGAAGIVAAKEALAENFDCDVFESSADVGGVWRPGGLAWPEMRVNISRYTSVFSDFSWEQAFPQQQIDDYPTREKMYAYLRAYINHFKLQPYIHTATKVIHVKKNETNWLVCWLSTGEEYEANYDAVILATGRYQIPFVPKFKNMENFKGEIIHSANYLSPQPFNNKKVLIVGGSVSSVAIAEEMALSAAKVIHLIRRPRWIMPIELSLDSSHATKKIPGDILYSRETYRKRDYAWFMQYCNAQNEIPAWKMTPETPQAIVVAGDYLEKVRAGNIEVIKDEIDYFTATAVHLKNGSMLDVDCVICCTGYQQDFSYLAKNILTDFSLPLELYDDTFPPAISGFGLSCFKLPSKRSYFSFSRIASAFSLCCI